MSGLALYVDSIGIVRKDATHAMVAEFLSETEARRIVAAVNGTAGISTAALEVGVVAKLVGLVIQYRDDLKRPPSGDSIERRLAAVNAAIAEMTGGAA